KDVKLVNPKYNLTSDTLRFNTESRTAFFVAPTNIFNDSSNIFCEAGYYNTRTEESEFAKNALVVNYPQIIKADTIYYNRKVGFGRALSNVTFRDTVRHTIIRCNKA